ncbi:MAG: metal-dependent transcriptional regulator [Planctomycetota bacterium]
MDTWKAFDRNLTHSAAHHLVAIAELLESFGYARVSDVARELEITRGSASVTLKRLKEHGLVSDDTRRFLGLTEPGARIAESIRNTKRVMMHLFIELLGVGEDQADVDSCKIEHLLSAETACRSAELLSFLALDGKATRAFLKSFRSYQKKQGGELIDQVEAKLSLDAAKAAKPKSKKGKSKTA